jgi:hypothetical protein
MPTTSSARAAWRDACEQALDVWRSDQPSLIDYTGLRDTRCLEVYAAAARTAPQIPLTPQSRGHARADAVGAAVAIRWLPQAASGGVCAAFEADRPHPLRRFFVDAPRGAGLTSWLRSIAREARLRGIVPLCPAAIARWPELLLQLHGRSVIVLADRWDSAPAAPQPGTALRALCSG